MTICPKCGKEAGPPIKEWTVTLRKQKAGPKGTGWQADPTKDNKATIQQYRCQNCGHPFRKGVPKK